MPRKSSAANNAKRSPYNVRQVVGDNVKARRVALGWSQQELADRFGVSRAAISQYEIGTGEVNAGDLPRLADILGVSLLEFYEGCPAGLNPAAGADREGSTARDWAVEAAIRLLEKHGLRETVRPRESQVITWPALNRRAEEHRAEEHRAEEHRAEGGLSGRGATEKPAGEKPGGDAGEEASGGADLSERQRRLRDLIQRSLAAARDRDQAGAGGERDARLAVLAGRFLSLPLRDQETLSRVAEALQDGPAQDGPAQNGRA